MDFVAVVDQALALLRQRGRVTYRTLQRQFQLDAEALTDLLTELRYTHSVEIREDDQGVVWTGDAGTAAALAPPSIPRDQHPARPVDLPSSAVPPGTASPTPDAERRQLTVLFCDLVDSTALAAQLDPEDWRGVVRAYQDTCARVIARFEGHIAQYLGDGLLVYFGYPRAHEDDAQRAVTAGLGMIEAVRQLNTRLAQERGVQLAVRLGIHTGLVVVGEMGGGGRHEQLALGDTPNLAARLQGLAAPNTLVISAATLPLLGGFFICQSLGPSLLKGFAQPLEVYQVLYESTARSRLEAAGSTGLTPLVGREQEVGLLLERWAQVKDGLGQVVLLSGEAGIGKSRLVHVLKEADYAPLSMSPEQQKQQIMHVLLTTLLRIAAQQPVLFVMEDLHWVDPTTLEFLTLLVDQGPTARILALFTFRPDFSPPWTGRSHLTQVTLPRLPRRQATAMMDRVAHGKALPPEVVAQVVAKTDGVPLFVEELTKMVLESGLLQEQEDRYALTGPLPLLAIPSTLHDSLMARLDRLATVKSLAQLGATLGREFAYALLHAVSPWDEETLRRGLHQLVEAEFLYQQGLPPQATYTFKHALIQDAAYQSLLKSTRQQYHQRVAQVLEAQFPDTAETQPELLAHHYTEAALTEQAVVYWQRAGQQTRQRSANLEAVQHLTRGLALLTTLPETPARAQQELALQLALGPVFMATKGYAAPEVEQTYARAQTLCQQIGETPQLFPTLRGLCRFYRNWGVLPTARALGEQLYRLAQREAEPTPLLEAHEVLGDTLFYLGEYAAARTHLEQGSALIDPTVQRTLVLHHDTAPGVRCLSLAANTLWCLGYPLQAMRRSQEALALAQELEHPQSLSSARHYAAFLHQRRRETPVVQAQADTLLSLATAQGFPFFVGLGTCWRGWVLAAQGRDEAGIAQIQQGLAALLAIGQRNAWLQFLVLLAEATGHAGRVNEGLRLLAEALTRFEESGRGDMLAEAYRLQGELLLHQATPDTAQAEACFHQALAIARRQQAKSWELRAAMSLVRLRQQQGKQVEACELLAPIYSWFTEGFDTVDLQEARALLEELEG